MIYKHYKGSLYFFECVAFPAYHATFENETDLCEAGLIFGDDVTYVRVVKVFDEKTGFHTVVFHVDSTAYEGAFCLYKDYLGGYWLRERGEFLEEMEDGTPRFKRMSEREVFDSLIVNNLTRIP